MENSIEIQVTALFDIDVENAKELEAADGLNEEKVLTCMAKAMGDVVETVLREHFESDKRIDVTFVVAKTISKE